MSSGVKYLRESMASTARRVENLTFQLQGSSSTSTKLEEMDTSTSPPPRSPTPPGGWLASAPNFVMPDSDGYTTGPFGPGGLSLLQIEHTPEVVALLLL